MKAQIGPRPAAKAGLRRAARCLLGGLTTYGLASLAAMTGAKADDAAPASLPPLDVRAQGSFFVGGHDEKSNFLAPPDFFFSPSGTITVDQMYVQYQLPTGAAKHTPIILIHGCCLTGKTWETTPDGRIGWA